MLVLVTGAAGHIGGEVTRELLGAGHRVALTDLLPVDEPRAERVLTGDLQDPELVRDAVAGVEAVVHLGAIPHPNVADPSALFAHNCLTAHRVFEEAGRAGVRRVVAASSISAVGLAWSPVPLSPGYVPLDEAHPTLVRDPYGLSKVVLEEVAAAAHRRWGTAAVCLRFPFTGVGDRLDHFLAACAEDPAGQRHDLWGWLHTADAATAVRLALERDLTGCHVINVTAADTTSTVPSAELMARHHPGVVARTAVTGHATLFDTSACTDLLGFVPRRTWRIP
ncbi:Nucleoside-diphosphate-sugar epimerase [Streptomyces sp. DvalAA-14]|uniref:NAD-dependent epimerase/dehydratase family protein n=1 Tax=unclassified Streptomyces TaxID=2593676 RepID=UPI00081AF5DC|nr:MULTISPECIES: NAD(P)-dependent oxidoreductase [unclassified Streptomyces]MYS20638.1 NAD-dependent epimerase/dehydratase family protein [Streptomyces sp. SID4948]SCD73625.1 Nucleoside-diphosphate-sugar epimerase [Streptomyces sp. DvalAA-14]